MDPNMEKKILDAAFDVVDKYSISGTRMHLIAKAAGTSQANLLYHYKTKNDLLTALLHSVQQEFTITREKLIENCPDTLEDKLNSFFIQKKKYTLDTPKYDRLQFDYWSWGQVDPDINTAITESYSIWREQLTDILLTYETGLDRKKASLIASTMISMMFGSALQYLNDPDSLDLEEYYKLCLDMILCYIEKAK